MQENIPKTKLYVMHILIILGIAHSLCFSASSETTLVIARFTPEVAKVTQNIYIDIIIEYTPRASAPNLLAIYTSNMDVIVLINNEQRIMDILCRTNKLNLFKRLTY